MALLRRRWIDRSIQLTDRWIDSELDGEWILNPNQI
jgi:hypothetical protein